MKYICKRTETPLNYNFTILLSLHTYEIHYYQYLHLSFIINVNFFRHPFYTYQFYITFLFELQKLNVLAVLKTSVSANTSEKIYK